MSTKLQTKEARPRKKSGWTTWREKKKGQPVIQPDAAASGADSAIANVQQSNDVNPPNSSSSRPMTRAHLNSNKRAPIIVKTEDDVIEISSDDEEEEPNAKRLKHSGGLNPKKNAMKSTVRLAFHSLTGWKTARDRLAVQKNNHGMPVFWTTNQTGQRLLTPVWDIGFDANWNIWGADFMRAYRQEARLHELSGYLTTAQTELAAQRCLRNGIWTRAFSAAAKEDKVTHEEVKADLVEDQSRKQLLLTRRRARTGTCLGAAEFDSLFMLNAQSPHVSDDEDGGTITRLEPSWLSLEVAKLKSALDQKSKLGLNKEVVVRYIRRDVPMKQPGDSKQYPLWGISKQWIKDSPGEFEKAKYMIDMAATAMPDISSLFELYGNVPRSYVGNAPEKQPQAEGSRHVIACAPARADLQQNALSTGNDKLLEPQPQLFMLVPVQTNGSAPQAIYSGSQMVVQLQPPTCGSVASSSQLGSAATR